MTPSFQAWRERMLNYRPATDTRTDGRYEEFLKLGKYADPSGYPNIRNLVTLLWRNGHLR